MVILSCHSFQPRNTFSFDSGCSTWPQDFQNKNDEIEVYQWHLKMSTQWQQLRSLKWLLWSHIVNSCQCILFLQILMLILTPFTQFSFHVSASRRRMVIFPWHWRRRQSWNSWRSPRQKGNLTYDSWEQAHLFGNWQFCFDWLHSSMDEYAKWRFAEEDFGQSFICQQGGWRWAGQRRSWRRSPKGAWSTSSY